MTAMRRSIVILCLAAVPVFGLFEVDFTVKFDPNVSTVGTSSFLRLSKTVAEATAAGWVETTKPSAKTGYESLVLMCPPEAKDRTICLLYDDNGYVAGLQIALVVNNLSDPSIDMLDAGYVKWQDTVNGETTEYFTFTVYYTTPEELEIPAATRLAQRKNEIVQNNLVLPGYKGTLHVISKDVSQLANSGFVKQACYAGMGDHYYYNMTTSLECTAESLLPWFILADPASQEMIGMGWVLPAKYSIPSGGLDPFEYPDEDTVKTIVPNGPQCFYDYGNTGLVATHFYFIKDAHLISC